VKTSNNPSVILIVDDPFSLRDYKRYGIKIFQQNMINIVIWEVDNVFHKVPEKLSLKYAMTKSENYRDIVNFKSKEEIKAAIRIIRKNTVVLICFQYQPLHRIIYSSLSKRGVYFGFISVNPIQEIPNSVNLVRRYASLMDSKFVSRLTTKLFQLLPPKLFSINYPNFKIVGGLVTEKEIKFPVNRTTKLIYSHSFDYDKFIEENVNQPKNKNNDLYAVFLDQAITYHPDIILNTGGGEAVDFEYFPLIESFFKSFEKNNGIKIVVATHPRVDYAKFPFSFGTRERKNISTIDLIKNASVVLAHASTSLNYAVIYKKPIILLNSRSFKKAFYHKIVAVGEELKISPSFLENLVLKKTNIKLSDIEIKNYKSYVDKYIKNPQSKNINGWEIFAEYCKNFKHE
jgi:hypothetical protein